MSGFGFGATKDDDDELDENGKMKELPYNYPDTLKCMKWGKISVGMRVKSVLTRTEGNISKMFIEYSSEMICVNWDNGNSSRYKKDDFNKVIRI